MEVERSRKLACQGCGKGITCTTETFKTKRSISKINEYLKCAKYPEQTNYKWIEIDEFDDIHCLWRLQNREGG
jgi:hypothetical protein